MNRRIKLKDLIRDILREDHGLGYGHNSTSDYDDVQFVRDPLNDPLLTDKMTENDNSENYNFRDFAWLSTMDGFNQPTDVLYGKVHLGVIASKPEGYVILTIDGPHGLVNVKMDEKNMFKTKNLAAAMLHTMWRLERQG